MNIRHQKQKYAKGAVSIAPTKKDNYMWSEDQVRKVLDFIKRHNLTPMSSMSNITHPEYVFSMGVYYLMRIVK